jgi:hypothetical protein
MAPFIRLSRVVNRAPFNCRWCSYPVVEYQSRYSPSIGGVALADYCSPRCAESNTAARLEVAYE